MRKFMNCTKKKCKECANCEKLKKVLVLQSYLDLKKRPFVSKRGNTSIKEIYCQINDKMILMQF